jgi:hypothetical protein
VTDEALKQPFPVILFLAGIVFIAIGAVGEWQGVVAIKTEIRWVLAVLGIILCISGVLLYLQENKGSSKTSSDFRDKIQKPEAFFRTINDGIPTFEERTRNVSEIKMLAKTSLNLMNDHYTLLTSLLNSGCNISFIVIDPECPAAGYMYGDAEATAKANMARSNAKMLQLAKEFPARFNVFYIKYVPPMSIVKFKNRDSSKSFVHVQLYMMHASVGTTRPIFFVPKNDKWYTVFCDEISQIESNATKIRV